MLEKTLDNIAATLKNSDDICIIAHVSPDGDTLGSSLALYHVLRALNKRVCVACCDSVPRVYSFLPAANEILLPKDVTLPVKLAVAVDCADIQRMGDSAALFEKAGATVNIDHHSTNGGYAQENCVDGDAAAAGEIIYKLVNLLTDKVDRDTAECLYVALMTDTGNFSYANTMPSTFETAAKLVALGADNARANRLVYRTVPLHKTKLIGRAIDNIALYFGGKVGISTLTQKEMREVGATGEDTEGIIDHVRDIEGVEVAMLIREEGENRFKVSLRSKTYADVSVIAAALGGGGHMRAAGYSICATLEETLKGAVDAAERII